MEVIFKINLHTLRKTFVLIKNRHLPSSYNTKTYARQESEKEQLVRKITHTFSKEVVDAELQHAQKVFEKYDINRDGYLDFDEVTPMLRDTYTVMGNNYQPSKSDTQKYIEMMDTDGDSKISLEEYEVFVLKA